MLERSAQSRDMDRGQGRLDNATSSRNSSRARENGLFGVGSYNYEELHTTSPHGPDGMRQQQGSIPLWVTIVTSAAFGVLAAGCVFWSGLAHSHTLVSSMGRACKGEGCTTVTGAFDCEGGEELAKEWSQKKPPG
ncbi:hypothetical protein AK812_SmicGene42780 [Symbiodinium microadriaticum]|uniref:Uncharacterized protein n=1 Tax=Symbiodinium microadriaticum TaxID=2951 RepID=A0A1Q9C2Q6_SYMMI|nr:hypothetical protein AK812_SmicGene42780 [Symbiodinium microadriaticum]